METLYRDLADLFMCLGTVPGRQFAYAVWAGDLAAATAIGKDIVAGLARDNPNGLYTEEDLAEQVGEKTAECQEEVENSLIRIEELDDELGELEEKINDLEKELNERDNRIEELELAHREGALDA